MAKPIVLSGIQPSGSIHLGNYLGALRPWVVTQDKYLNYFCIVDLHAITTRQNPKVLWAQTRQLAAIYLAVGLDPARSTIFVQSHVRAHVELQWLLNCVTPMGWLSRMTQFKEKSGDTEAESIGAGLFGYPVLMASDILCYQTDFVPVGDDQRQHLELTRDIATRFNHLYGETFKLPQALIGHLGAGSRIMDLNNPMQKMSKSGPGANHAVLLLDPPDVVRRKLRRAQTDSAHEIRVEQAGPGITNLIEISRSLSSSTLAEAGERFNGMLYGEFKDLVADEIISALTPVQAKFHELTADPEHLEMLLRDGADRAEAVAEQTATLVRERMGVG